MKAIMHMDGKGDDRACVFTIPEKPEAGEFRAITKDYESGKDIKDAARKWAQENGASL